MMYERYVSDCVFIVDKNTTLIGNFRISWVGVEVSSCVDDLQPARLTFHVELFNDYLEDEMVPQTVRWCGCRDKSIVLHGKAGAILELRIVGVGRDCVRVQEVRQRLVVPLDES